MGFECFEDIIDWQKAKDLTIAIYKLYKNCNDYGFKDQIQRASISIMNNIAEGFERKSNNEFKYFLYVAKGSCAEVRSMLLVGKELNKMNEEDFERLYSLSYEISKMLSRLIKKIK